MNVKFLNLLTVASLSILPIASVVAVDNQPGTTNVASVAMIGDGSQENTTIVETTDNGQNEVNNGEISTPSENMSPQTNVDNMSNIDTNEADGVAGDNKTAYDNNPLSAPQMLGVSFLGGFIAFVCVWGFRKLMEH